MKMSRFCEAKPARFFRLNQLIAGEVVSVGLFQSGNIRRMGWALPPTTFGQNQQPDLRFASWFWVHISWLGCG
jgi:hypothetical protein